jgi:hypothetical protein
MRARCGLSNLPMAIETGTDPSGLSSFTRVPEIIRLVIWVFLTIEAFKRLCKGCQGRVVYLTCDAQSFNQAVSRRFPQTT